MNDATTWRPSHRKSEETGQILDRAFDDAGQPVPVVAPEVYAESPFSPSQLMAAKICLGAERGRTLRDCAVEVDCSIQNLSIMVKDYSQRLKDGFGMRGPKVKK